MSESSGVHVDTNRRGTRSRIRVVSSAKAGESPRATRRRSRAAREQRGDQLPVHPAIAGGRQPVGATSNGDEPTVPPPPPVDEEPYPRPPTSPPKSRTS